VSGNSAITALRKQIDVHVRVLWKARARRNLLKVEKQKRKIKELRRTLVEFEAQEMQRVS